MSIEEDPYSLNFDEEDQASSSMSRSKKKNKKPHQNVRSSSSISSVSLTKSDLDTKNNENQQESSHGRHRQSSVQVQPDFDELDNSIADGESISAGSSPNPITFRNLLPPFSSKSWFPSVFKCQNYFSPSKLYIRHVNLSQKFNEQVVRRHFVIPSGRNTNLPPPPPLSLAKPGLSLGDSGLVEPRSSRSGQREELGEMERIMEKLSQLEKAHDELENVMALSEIEEEQSMSSQFSHSAATSMPSKSHPTTSSVSDSRRSSRHQSSIKGHDDLSTALSAEMDAVRQLLGGIESDAQKEIFTKTNDDSQSQSRPETGDAGADRTIEELFKQYDSLEKSFAKGDEGGGDGQNLEQLLSRPGMAKADSVLLETELGFPPPVYKVGPVNPKPATDSNNKRITHLPPKVPSSKTTTDLATEGIMGNRVAIPAGLPTEGILGNRVPIPAVEKQVSLAARNSSSEIKSNNKTSSATAAHVSKNAKNVPKALPRSVHSVIGNPTMTGGLQPYDVPTVSEEIKEKSKSEAKELENLNRMEKMKSDIDKLTALTESYQKENHELYSQQKAKQDEAHAKEHELMDQISRLKTEIATVKLKNLLPTKQDHAAQLFQKKELDQLKAESSSKSQQLFDLHREIARLKLEANRPKSAASAKQPIQKVAILSQEKEKEYQRNVKALQKQVRTLQKIIYHKDPSSAMSSSATATSLKFGSQDKDLELFAIDDATDQTQQLKVLETRIVELEGELARADSASNEKLKEFQLKFTNLRIKNEERIKDLEKRLEESESRTKAPELLLLEESNLKLERCQTEISQLKLEVGRYKREFEIAAKSSVVNSSVQANAKQDAGTLSLAIKSFKAELSEKEKELIRTKKEVADLRKTNLHLKREREKYLTSRGSSNVFLTKPTPLNRAKSDLVQSATVHAAPSRKKSEPLRKPNSAGAGATQIINSDAIQMLQLTLESERCEFEEIVNQKNRLLVEKENMIAELKQKSQNLQKIDLLKTRKNSEDNTQLLEELRSRVTTQNKVILTLKEHITSTSGSQAELIALRKEKGAMEFRIRELGQQLALAKTLSKPDNEILSDLSEKVDSLNSRYQYREKQLDTLLKIAAKNGSYSSSLVNDLVLGNSTLETEMGLLSPTTSMQLYTDPTEMDM